MSIQEVRREIERRLLQGLAAAVETAGEGYRKRVTAEESPPPSEPGEYPHEDTGQGERNITYGTGRAKHNRRELAGRFGVMGDKSRIPIFPGQDHRGGEHLDWLREDFGRLGMDSSFAEDLDAVRRAFMRGTRR